MQLEGARANADGSGMQPASSPGVAALVVAIDSSLAAGGYQLVFPSIPRWGQIVEADLYYTGGFTGKLDTVQGRLTWTASGVAAGSTPDNGGQIAISPELGNRIVIAGTAATLTAVDATEVHAFVKWKMGPHLGVTAGSLALPQLSGSSLPQWSSALFGEFADDAQGDVPSTGDLRAMFAREEARIAGAGGGSAGVQQPGSTFKPLTLCNAAYADPWGKVFLTSADIGNGIGQISTDRVNWQAEQFRQHPQVFMRLGDHVRGLGIALPFGVLDAFPLAGPVATMRLWEVTRPPTFSSWLLIADGLPFVATFQHPAGSDLRRPADIWNGVIAPAISERSAYGGPGDPPGTGVAVGPAMTWEPLGAGGVFPLVAPVFPANTFRQRDGLPRRLQHLSYARILELWDSAGSINDDPPYVEIPTIPEP